MCALLTHVKTGELALKVRTETCFVLAHTAFREDSVINIPVIQILVKTTDFVASHLAEAFSARAPMAGEAIYATYMCAIRTLVKMVDSAP